MHKNKRRNIFARTTTSLLAAVVLAAGAVIGATVAYLFAQNVQKVNTFRFAEVSCEVDEATDKGVKTDVSIQNTGDADAFIRAAVIVTWKDASGNIYPENPVMGTDYTIGYGSSWVKRGGFYYYVGENGDRLSAVKSGDFTNYLIAECQPVEGKAPDGYGLNVEILAAAIQNVPVTAVCEAWGLTADPDGSVPVNG